MGGKEEKGEVGGGGRQKAGGFIEAGGMGAEVERALGLWKANGLQNLCVLREHGWKVAGHSRGGREGRVCPPPAGGRVLADEGERGHS